MSLISAARFRIVLIAMYLAISGCSRSPDTTLVKLESIEEAVDHVSVGWPNIYGPDHDSTSHEANVHSRWPDTGPVVLWRRDLGTGFSAPVSSGDETILLSRVGNEEIVSCLGAADGKFIWEHRYPTSFQCKYDYSNGPYSTPVITDDHVITISAAGLVHCFDRTSGSVVWKRDLFQEYTIAKRDWPFAGSPLVLEDRLILNLGASDQNTGVIALDLNDGNTLWKATNDGYAHTTPTVATIHGHRLVFVLTFEGLVCPDPQDGTVHWTVEHQTRDPTGMNGINAVSPVVVGDRICIVSGPKVKPGLRCFRILPNGEYDEPWRDIRLLKSQYTNMVGIDGHLFAFTPMTVGGPTLKCIDIINGEIAWKGKLGLGRGNMLAVNDSILILGEDGTLASFELSASKLIERSRTTEPVLEAPCYTSMALNQGLLFARNEKELICFDLRSTSAKSPALVKNLVK